MCDRRRLTPEASDLLGAMLEDLGDAVRVHVGRLAPACNFGDDEGHGAQGDPATADVELAHETAPAVATYGSQEREGTGVAVPVHPSPTTAPGCRLSGPTERGRATNEGNGAPADRTVSTPALGTASLSERLRDRQEAYQHSLLLAERAKVEQLEAMLRRARGRETLAIASARFWRRRFELASNPRGHVARADAAAGELKLARVAGGAEQLLRAATRLLRHAMQDPAAVSSTAWADEAREVLRAEDR